MAGMALSQPPSRHLAPCPVLSSGSLQRHSLRPRVPATPALSARGSRTQVSASAEKGGETVASGACPGCGRAEGIIGGCNAEGRIQGGLGAVPGFGWWPIKAFRPCPAFVASGGRYRRQGQSLDEVAFGRKGLDDDLDVSERLEKLADSDVAARIKKLKEEEDKARSS